MGKFYILVISSAWAGCSVVIYQSISSGLMISSSEYRVALVDPRGSFTLLYVE